MKLGQLIIIMTNLDIGLIGYFDIDNKRHFYKWIIIQLCCDVIILDFLLCGPCKLSFNV